MIPYCLTLTQREFRDLDQWYATPLGQAYFASVWIQAQALCGSLAGQVVLEVGSGSGIYTLELARVAAQLSAVEPSASLRALTRRQLDRQGLQVDLREARAEALPFESSSFDRLLCLNVLEFVEDRARALAEFKRVLRPQGSLILAVLNRASVWGVAQRLGRVYSQDPFFYGQFYSRAELRRLLSDSGFSLEAERAAVSFLPASSAWLRRLPIGPPGCWLVRARP